MDNKVTPKKQLHVKEALNIIERAIHCCADCQYFDWHEMSCPHKSEKMTLEQAYEPIDCEKFGFARR